MELTLVEYRELPEYPGFRIGSDGSVWSCWKHRGLGKGRGTMRYLSGEWKLRKPVINPQSGYAEHTVLKRTPDGSRRSSTKAAHFLVLTAVRGPCPNGMEGCHNNGNRADARLDNLRWDTRKNNHADKKLHGTWQAGEKHPRAVLT